MSTFAHISEDSGIFRILSLPVPKTSTRSWSQVFLVFPCSNLFWTFFHFHFKIKHSAFFLKDSLSITTITIIICNMHLCITHITFVNPRLHTTHTSMLPTQVRHLHHLRTLATHATQSSTNSMPFFKLYYEGYHSRS